MAKKCYICENVATSKEHTPARCYFPNDSSYRKNLITVPSCDTHNQDTSKDDEYVRNLIAMSFGTNSIAFKQFLDKIVKSFKKSPGMLHAITGNRKRVVADSKRTYAFQIDRPRFDSTMKKISYAIFYHKYKQPWKRELIILTKNLLTNNMEMDELGKLMKQYEKYLPQDNFDGENPQIFKYIFGQTLLEDQNELVLRMTFYEGFLVWVVPKNGTTVPRIN